MFAPQKATLERFMSSQYGRGRGKLRSRMGENTVVVGGNYGRGWGKFLARSTHRKSSQSGRPLYLCSKEAPLMMKGRWFTHMQSTGSAFHWSTALKWPDPEEE